jgi:hypothetical protein
MSNSNGSKASWQQLYESAAHESDPPKLTELIVAVEDALLRRQKELAGSPHEQGELLQVKAAARKLLLIKSERLGWPTISSDRQ